MSRLKERTPYEIKNAREWDPNRKAADYASSDESSDYEYDDDEWGEDNYSTSTERAKHDLPPQAVATKPVAAVSLPLRDRTQEFHVDDGFQIVTSKPRKRASRQPSQFAAAKQPLQARPASLVPPLSPDRRSSRSQHTISSRRPPRLLPPHKHRPIFTFKKDNAAKAAFRKRLPPNEKFVLYKDAYEIEPDRKRMYDVFEEIGVRLNSFIRPPQNMHDRELLIWGNNRQAAQTVSAVKEWLQRMEDAPQANTRAKDHFSKAISTITEEYKAEMRRIERDAAAKRFQQVPEPGRHFEFTGTYLWPMDEVNPHDVFGLSIEAFDSVRFKNKCHIVFDDRQEAFRVFSDKKAGVEGSIECIERALKGFVAQNSRRIVEHLVELPPLSCLKQEVKLLQGSLSKTGAVISKVPLLSGKPLNPVARSKWLLESQVMQNSNVQQIVYAFQRVVAILPYYHGQLRIRVVFGSFELRMFKCPGGKNVLSLEEFLINIRLPGTKGNLIQDIRVAADATTVMEKILDAKDIFVPTDAVTEGLTDVVPVISGRFVIHRLDKPSVELEMEFSFDSVNGLYEVTHALWSRHDQKETRTPLEVFMVCLDNGCSWEVKISNEHNLDQSRIDPKMKMFAGSVKLKNADRCDIARTGKKQFDWIRSDYPGCLKPSEFEQKISYRYRLASNASWTFEIAHHDCYGPYDDMPTTTYWGASMWNKDWDSVLTENSGLTIGEVAEWDPFLSTFFENGDPSTNNPEAGISQFLQTVQMVNDIVNEIKRT